MMDKGTSSGKQVDLSGDDDPRLSLSLGPNPSSPMNIVTMTSGTASAGRSKRTRAPDSNGSMEHGHSSRRLGEQVSHRGSSSRRSSRLKLDLGNRAEGSSVEPIDLDSIQLTEQPRRGQLGFASGLVQKPEHAWRSPRHLVDISSSPEPSNEPAYARRGTLRNAELRSDKAEVKAGVIVGSVDTNSRSDSNDGVWGSAGSSGSHCPSDDMVVTTDSDFRLARQLAEDEKMARELNDSFLSELNTSQPSASDEVLASMLQAEEHARGGILRYSLSGLSSVNRGTESQSSGRESHRHFRAMRTQSASYSSGSSASSSRIGMMQGSSSRSSGGGFRRLRAPPGLESHTRRVQFPPNMGVEARVEVLSALEMALEGHLPVELQLAHVDRDFNENDYEMLLALDEDIDRNRGASHEKIARLPVSTVKATDKVDETCSICLDVPEIGQVVRRLPCIHVFHQQCIDRWLQSQAVCPVCKAHI